MRTIPLAALAAILWFSGCVQRDTQGTAVKASDPRLAAVDEFIHRKQYAKLTKGVLEHIRDDLQLEQAIIDYVDRKVAKDPAGEYRIVTGMSKGIQAVYTTSDADDEICNGGFNQYFWNPSGQFAEQALAGYRLLGAPKHAQVMAAAIAVFSREAPSQRKFKAIGTLKAFGESYQHTDLNQLDTRYYPLETSEDTDALRAKYIRKHPDQFVGN